MATNNGSNGSANLGAQQMAPKGIWLEYVLLKQGVDTAVPGSIAVAGQTLTQAQMSDELGTVIAIFMAVADAKQKLQQALEAKVQAMAALRARYQAYKDALISQFGRGSPELLQFGLKPRKARTELTPEQKVLRAAKSKLTRAKRHTMGKRQKAKVKSTGTPTLTLGADGTQIVPPIEGGGQTTGSK